MAMLPNGNCEKWENRHERDVLWWWRTRCMIIITQSNYYTQWWFEYIGLICYAICNHILSMGGWGWGFVEHVLMTGLYDFNNFQ